MKEFDISIKATENAETILIEKRIRCFSVEHACEIMQNVTRDMEHNGKRVCSLKITEPAKIL